MKREFILGILGMIERLKKSTQLPFKRLCDALELPYGTLMRWKGRRERGKPLVRRPGPAKTVPFDLSALKDELAGLKHCPQRTRGTAAVYVRVAPFISRRDFYFMLKQVRYDAYLDHQRNLRRINWNIPGAVWAMDDTEYEYGRTAEGGKFFIHQVQDLASIMKFLPLAGEIPRGEETAAHLEYLFYYYGVPLVLKRDNAGNLCSMVVDEILEDYGIIPLTSPPYYPPYNGCVERAQAELKKLMSRGLEYKSPCPGEHISAYAKYAALELNQRPRRSLHGRNANQVFSGDKRNYNKRERRKIYDLIKTYAERILNAMDDHTQKTIQSAWRIAVETVLRSKGIITVSINGKVLPNFKPILTHY